MKFFVVVSFCVLIATCEAWVPASKPNFLIGPLPYSAWVLDGVEGPEDTTPNLQQCAEYCDDIRENDVFPCNGVCDKLGVSDGDLW